VTEINNAARTILNAHLAKQVKMQDEANGDSRPYLRFFVGFFFGVILTPFLEVETVTRFVAKIPMNLPPSHELSTGLSEDFELVH